MPFVDQCSSSLRIARLLVPLISILLVLGCESGASKTGVVQGINTSAYAGSYSGMFSVAITVEAGSYGPKAFSSSSKAVLRVNEDGTSEFLLGSFVIPGIVSDDGNWQLDLGINDLGGFIDAASINTLRKVGCPLDKRFARLSGEITPPALTGQVTDKLSCRVMMVPVGSMEGSGAIKAAR